MTKLKPLLVGLSLGISFSIVYTLRTAIFWMFPNFIVSLSQKLPYDMAFIQPGKIIATAFLAGIAALFVAGMVFGIIFALVYNLFTNILKSK